LLYIFCLPYKFAPPLLWVRKSLIGILWEWSIQLAPNWFFTRRPPQRVCWSSNKAVPGISGTSSICDRHQHPHIAVFDLRLTSITFSHLYSRCLPNIWTAHVPVDWGPAKNVGHSVGLSLRRLPNCQPEVGVAGWPLIINCTGAVGHKIMTRPVGTYLGFVDSAPALPLHNEGSPLIHSIGH